MVYVRLLILTYAVNRRLFAPPTVSTRLADLRSRFQELQDSYNQLEKENHQLKTVPGTAGSGSFGRLLAASMLVTFEWNV